MTVIFRSLLLTQTLLILSLSPASAQDWQAISRACDRGDYNMIMRMVCPAAEEGWARAQAVLGFMYYEGESVPQDYVKAARWYRRAAEQGDIEAQFALARMYYLGLGVPRDEAKAVRWYRRAGEQGDAVAQAVIGIMYSKGEGVPRDEAESLRWYRRAGESQNSRGAFSCRMSRVAL